MFSISEWTLLGLCAVAAVTDMRAGTIPNWLTLPVLILAPIAYAIVEFPQGLYRSLAGIAVCGIVPMILFFKRGIGGGDVKLLAAVGAVGGYMVGLEIQLFAFIIAAIYAVLMLSWKGVLFRTLSNAFFLAFNTVLPESRQRPISPEVLSSVRFGLPIFLGACLSISIRSATLWA